MKRDRREFFGLGALAGLVGLSSAKAAPSAEAQVAHHWITPERQPFTHVCGLCMRSFQDNDVARSEWVGEEWRYTPNDELSWRSPRTAQRRLRTEHDPKPWWELPCPGRPVT